MKKIRLIWTGKSKERFILEGIRKYRKLLDPYIRLDVLELKEAGGTDREDAIRRESKGLLEKTSSFVLLDAGGEAMNSEEFARFLQRLVEDPAPMDIVLGGAFGVTDEVRRKAGKRVSLSPLTFTHQMARVILLEQMYRAFTILQGRAYHY